MVYSKCTNYENLLLELEQNLYRALLFPLKLIDLVLFFVETTLITDNLSSNISLPKRIELDKAKKMEASMTAYEFLILQHAALKCILEKKKDTLLNVTMSDKFKSRTRNLLTAIEKSTQNATTNM